MKETIRIRCPYCGKQSVRLKRNHIVGHKTKEKLPCVGKGKSWN